MSVSGAVSQVEKGQAATTHARLLLPPDVPSFARINGQRSLATYWSVSRWLAVDLLQAPAAGNRQIRLPARSRRPR